MGNTEGSRVIPYTYKARKNLQLKLTKQQLSVVLGSVLGDAYIYPKGKICIEHASIQKEYLLWKYHLLQPLTYAKVSKVVRIDNRTQTTSYRFFMRQYFRPLRRIFYQQNRKQIPSAIKYYFNNLVLAIWYMDDGYLDKNQSSLLMTDCYNESEIEFLMSILKTQMGIASYSTSKNRIRVKRNSLKRFFQMVEPWIVPCMRYKLP